MHRKFTLSNVLGWYAKNTIRKICFDRHLGQNWIRDENQENNGISHFVEHMLFKVPKQEMRHR